MAAGAGARRSAEDAARAFGAYLRAQRESARLSLRELARLADISNPYLSQIERGLHQPSVTVIRSLAEALNLSAEVLLAEAAGLQRVAGGVRSPDGTPDASFDANLDANTDGGSGTSDVEKAVRADSRLTESQKSALIGVYRSMAGDV